MTEQGGREMNLEISKFSRAGRLIEGDVDPADTSIGRSKLVQAFPPEVPCLSEVNVAKFAYGCG